MYDFVKNNRSNALRLSNSVESQARNDQNTQREQEEALEVMQEVDESPGRLPAQKIQKKGLKVKTYKSAMKAKLYTQKLRKPIESFQEEARKQSKIRTQNRRILKFLID